MSEKQTEVQADKEVKTEGINEETENSSENLEDENVESESSPSESSGNGEDKDDYKSKFYYLAAEMENLKKRFDREKQNLIKFGNEKVLSELLSVMDNFELTLNALQNDEDEKIKNIVVGIEMVRNQFIEVLKKSGLEPIDCVGKVFDPNLHEAVGQEEAEGREDQEILKEFQKGYILNGRLLRASKVIIVKANK